MSRTKGSFSLAGAIEPLASAPLDARGKVATKADLTAEGSFPYPYIGMETYVEAENKKYRLIGNDPTSLANWQEVGAGGGSGDANAVELTQAEYDALTEEEKNNGTIYFITNAPNGSDIQLSVMPTASYSYANMIVQYVGETTQTYTNGYFYKCVENGGNYSWNPCPTQEGGSGGDASLETDVTSNLTVGAINSGTTLPEGTTFTEFVQKLLITEIAPTTTFTASGSGVKEVGTSITPTLTLTITGKGTGTPVSIKFYNGSTLLDTQPYVDGTNTYTYTMESAIASSTTVKGVLEYKKSDNTNATIEKSATYTFVMASYYGAVATAPTDKAGIIALTKNVKNTKALTATFNLSNQRACYCYPTSMGNLTSIKDANGFDYISGYTKTTVSVDGTDYNVYTQTDPVTATGFKQIYA